MGGMIRITERMDNGTAFVASETGTEGVGHFTTQRRVPEMISRLAAYEDTGLTPDEIAALKDEMAAIHAGQMGGYNVYQLANLLYHAGKMDADKDAEIASLKTDAKLLESDRDIEREMRLGLESEVERLRAEIDRVAPFLAAHGVFGYSLQYTPREAAHATMGKGVETNGADNG